MQVHRTAIIVKRNPKPASGAGFLAVLKRNRGAHIAGGSRAAILREKNMHFLRAGVLDRERATECSECRGTTRTRGAQGPAAGRLRAAAAILLTLAATTPSGFAQQAGTAPARPDKAASDLPVAPVPVPTQADRRCAPPAAITQSPTGRGWAIRSICIGPPLSPRRTSRTPCAWPIWSRTARFI